MTNAKSCTVKSNLYKAIDNYMPDFNPPMTEAKAKEAFNLLTGPMSGITQRNIASFCNWLLLILIIIVVAVLYST